ncbi:hypothetical protein PGT21_004231 [Puccinia graminis f. sp. tritici]|uniref:Uncharacterized protein n=1 Tax=Puccinia graminis f. sp. tritici TaxID=56615 RepID=A0A5B0N9T0_PUCGR|nr:hypothetical protein PGT21_004231 [Puccinia graminis f. sp. tritici]KAA1118449.1 hypothetical protein PGTUg99_006872 [Puccinia graminis f. sp. tritici]
METLSDCPVSNMKTGLKAILAFHSSADEKVLRTVNYEDSLSIWEGEGSLRDQVPSVKGSAREGANMYGEQSDSTGVMSEMPVLLSYSN